MINDINTNSWITANAGCGKTTRLASEFLQLLKNNIKVNEILCITYTEAGAKEIKNGIIKKTITNGSIKIDEKKLEISTIHSLCKQFLTEINVIDEKNINILNDDPYTMGQIIRKIIENYSNNTQQQNQENIYLESEFGNLKNEFNKIVKTLALTENINAFNKLIQDVINNQNLFLDLFTNICDDKNTTTINILNNIKINNIYKLLPEDVRNLVNKRDEISDFGKRLERELRQQKIDVLISNVYKILGNKKADEMLDKIYKNSGNYNQLYDIKNWKNIVLTTNNTPRKSLEKLHIGLIDDIKEYYIRDLKQIGVDGAYAMLCFAFLILREYQNIKQKMNVITYDDLLFQTLLILESGKIEKQCILLQTKHLLLDEAQDTNQISWKIIRNIIEKTKCKIFVVGDEKQSIYRFQGARVEEYEKNRELFRQISKKMNIEFNDTEKLDESRRSIQPILTLADQLCNSKIIPNEKSDKDGIKYEIRNAFYITKNNTTNNFIKHKVCEEIKNNYRYNLCYNDAIHVEKIDLSKFKNEDNNISDNTEQKNTQEENKQQNNNNRCTDEESWINRTNKLIQKRENLKQYASEIAGRIANYINIYYTEQIYFEKNNNETVNISTNEINSITNSNNANISTDIINKSTENNDNDYNSKGVAIIFPKKSTKSYFIFDVIEALKNKYNIDIDMKSDIMKMNIYFADILSFYKFSVLQNDNMNLACILKSDLFKIDDSILYTICTSSEKIKSGNTLWQKIQNQTLVDKNSNDKVKFAVKTLRDILNCTSLEEITAEIEKIIQNNSQYWYAFFLIKSCIDDKYNKYKDIYNYNIRGFLRAIETKKFKDDERQKEEFSKKKDILQQKRNIAQNNMVKEIFFSTIHGVKGKEFDTVLLLDFEEKKAGIKDKMFFLEDSFWYKISECKIQKDDPDCEKLLHELDEKEQQDDLEKWRLLYVAITRAKRRFVYFGNLEKSFYGEFFNTIDRCNNDN